MDDFPVIYNLYRDNPHRDKLLEILKICDDINANPVMTGVAIKKRLNVSSFLADKLLFLLVSLRVLYVTHLGPAGIYQITVYGDRILEMDKEGTL